MDNSKNTVENAEYGVDSRYRSGKERKEESIALMQARLDRMKNLSKEQIIRAKLLQLKLKMEAYLTNDGFDNTKQLTQFLKIYIDTIYTKRSEFAKDIGVTPVVLSQIINNHRQPNDEFILKLMVHSEIAFRNVCDFQKELWLRVYFQEKVRDTMASQDTWRPLIEKQVSFSEVIEE